MPADRRDGATVYVGPDSTLAAGEIYCGAGSALVLTGGLVATARAGLCERRFRDRVAGHRGCMAAGIVLIILGAVFTFALRSDGTWIDTRILGVILMLGGVAFIWRARVRRKVVVTRETEQRGDAAETEERTVTERRVE